MGATLMHLASQAQSNSVSTALLADNILSADSTGRGKMQDGFFSADSTGRAKFASSFVTPTLTDRTQTWDFTSGVLRAANPSGSTDVATKSYVDAAAVGISWKPSVKLATTAKLDDNTDISGSPSYSNTGGTSGRGQITATLAVTGIFNVDSGITANGTRLLLKNEGDSGGLGGAANGIWTVTISGTSLTLDRATDADSDAEVKAGTAVFVTEGTSYADTGWVLTTNDTITLGGASGTALTFTQFTGGGSSPVAGDGITVSGSTVSVRADTTSSVQSILVNSGASPNGVAVKFDSAGAIDATAAGTRVRVGSATGLQISTNDLGIKIDSAGSLSVSSSGIKDNVSSTGGLQISSSLLSVKLPSDSGLATASGGTSVQTDASTIEIGTGTNQLRIKDTGVSFAKLAAAVSDRLGRYDRREDFTGSSGSTVDLAVNDVDSTGAGLLVYKNGQLLRGGAGNDYQFGDNAGGGSVDQIQGLTRTTSDLITVIYKRTGNVI